MDGMILLGGYDSADSDASDKEEEEQPAVVKVTTEKNGNPDVCLSLF
jgi:hypothetical protein